MGSPVNNIILITLDDLGNQVGFLGDSNAVTPNLDLLAQESVVFTNAYASQSSCSPSRASILTGLMPSSHGHISLSNGSNTYTLQEDIAVLPNILKEEGYYTGLLGKLHVSPEEIFEFDGSMKSTSVTRSGYLTQNAVKTFFEMGNDKNFLMLNIYDPHVDESKNFINQYKGAPEVILTPEDVEPLSFQGVIGSSLERISSYYNSVTRADHTIGRVISYLKEAGIYNDALIIVASDNGPPFIRGKTSSYEAGIRVPLIIKAPGAINRSEDALVNLSDIMPTILSYVGLEERQGLHGKSLTPLIKKEVERIRDYQITEFFYHKEQTHVFFPKKSVRRGDWKLIYNLNAKERGNLELIDGDFVLDMLDEARNSGNELASEVYDRYLSPPEFELYDLSTDPNEFNNLARDPSHLAKLEELKRQIVGEVEDTILIDHGQKSLKVDLGSVINEGASIVMYPGEDADQFDVINGDQIFFKSLPSYTNPKDSDGDNVYSINVLITDFDLKVSKSTINIEVLPTASYIDVDVLFDAEEDFSEFIANIDRSDLMHTPTADSIWSYRDLGWIKLKIEMYKSARKSKNMPAIAFYHGGGLISRSGQYRRYAKYFADQGFQTFLVTYRVLSDSSIVQPYHSLGDVKESVRQLRIHAEKLKIDPNKIVGAGMSAGGLLVTASSLIEMPGAIDLSATSFNGYMLHYPKLEFERRFGKQLDYDQWSPMDNIENCHSVPSLIMSGTSDSITPFGDMIKWDSIYSSKGCTSYLYGFSGRTHGFGNYEESLSGPGHRDFYYSLYIMRKFLREEGFCSPDTTILNVELDSGMMYEVGGESFNTVGDYTVTMMNQYGCDSIINIHITKSIIDDTPPKIISTLADTVIENDNSWSLEILASEPSEIGMGTFSDEQYFELEGSYLRFKNAPDYENPLDRNSDNVYLIRIKATDTVGNTSISEINIKVANKLDESIEIFPNPASYWVQIRTQRYIKVQIYNENREIVYESHFKSGFHKIRTDEIGKGPFFFRVSDANGLVFLRRLLIN